MVLTVEDENLHSISKRIIIFSTVNISSMTVDFLKMQIDVPKFVQGVGSIIEISLTNANMTTDQIGKVYAVYDQGSTLHTKYEFIEAFGDALLATIGYLGWFFLILGFCLEDLLP